MSPKTRWCASRINFWPELSSGQPQRLPTYRHREASPAQTKLVALMMYPSANGRRDPWRRKLDALNRHEKAVIRWLLAGICLTLALAAALYWRTA
jgi:hypothetical protein